MKFNNLQKILLCGSIIWGGFTFSSNVFADTIPQKIVVQKITTAGKDTFEIVENRYEEGREYSSYELNQSTRNGIITFKIIADNGTTLGDLENSANIIDSTRELEDGRIEYTFHYTLFDYEPTRIININVTVKN